MELKRHGMHNYSIFYDQETHFLFGYAEIESEKQWDAISNTNACKEWWVSMRDLMETNPDDSPVSKDLIEIFHLK